MKLFRAFVIQTNHSDLRYYIAYNGIGRQSQSNSDLTDGVIKPPNVNVRLFFANDPADMLWSTLKLTTALSISFLHSPLRLTTTTVLTPNIILRTFPSCRSLKQKYRFHAKNTSMKTCTIWNSALIACNENLHTIHVLFAVNEATPARSVIMFDITDNVATQISAFREITEVGRWDLLISFDNKHSRASIYSVQYSMWREHRCTALNQPLRPHRLWDPRSLFSNGYRGSLARE